ncbi:S-adenosylmethionine:tRNA ribosyltransferase-isomerase [soil metagenome]
MSAVLDTLDFTLPEELEAHAPPPGGLHPEGTRLLVAERSTGLLTHARLSVLPALLDPGDLLVVNTTAVLPAAVDAGIVDGVAVRLHWSTADPAGHGGDGKDRDAIVELRAADGPSSRPFAGGYEGLVLNLPGGGWARLRGRAAPGSRLWAARLHLPGGRDAYLARHGQPIRYGAGVRVGRAGKQGVGRAGKHAAWPLAAAQTVFARNPGSAESPSASLAFDDALVSRLAAAGIGIAPIVLHTGVASQEEPEPPYAEWFQVAAPTAEHVNGARRAGHRVIAVGTTVTRALESAATPDGIVRAAEGWTEEIIDPCRGVRAIDGLISGWHEPRASHLALLEAVAGRSLLADSYSAALSAGYRWHTFGDLHLVLP